MSLPEQREWQGFSPVPTSCVIVSKESPRDPLITSKSGGFVESFEARAGLSQAIGICELCSCSGPAVVECVH
jgi:hypothetical protein